MAIDRHSSEPRRSVATPPLAVGESVRPSDLHGWTYLGLSGRPDRDAHAVRRYRKGEWFLELRAYTNQARPAKVVSIRTLEQDDAWWAAQRARGQTS